MIKRISQKLSSVFLRLHRIFGRYGNTVNSVAPYRLKTAGSKGKPKILHVNGNFVIGGTSQLIVDLIERTSDEFSHSVIVPAYPKPLPYQPLSIKAFSLSEMPKLYDWLKTEKPALVHIHYWVRHEHRYFDFGIWYSAVFKMCEELGLNVIQNINVPTKPFESSAVLHNVFVSEYVKHEFNHLQSIPSSVIYPGSDLDFFNDEIPEELPFTVGMVYRLDPDKLNPEAIEIFIEAVRSCPGIKCHIVGGGYYLSHYRKRVKEEGITDSFIFTGYLPYKELPDEYKKIGLIVAPVHDESFGQVTPFAMGMGKAVTGYATGAVSEILGSNKELADYGDRKKLVELITGLMKDPGKRQNLGIYNRERARELFGITNMIEAYRELYDSVLSPTEKSYQVSLQ